MEKGVNITNLINRIVQVLKKDLYWVKISIKDTELIKLVKLQDKGQPTYIIEFSIYRSLEYGNVSTQYT